MAMFTFGLILLVASVAMFIFGKASRLQQWVVSVVGTVLLALSTTMLIASTAIYVEDNEAGIVSVKFGSDLPSNKIIATNGEKGPQAYVLPPGWHFGFWPWQYELESVPIQTIETGHIGLVTAFDGKPLPAGEVYAPEWENPEEMLDGEIFLTSGKGFRGPQLTVLPPGQYRYNPRLFKIDPYPYTEVKVGTVAVIKANAGPIYDGETELVNGVPIVPKGYRGIWKEALTPNNYYLHPLAYNTTIVKTINRIYNYAAEDVGQAAEGAANRDNSIGVRTKDAYEFPVDVRVSVKISAENAPYVVARLAEPDLNTKDGLDVLQEVVVLPAIRAIFRNSAETRSALEYVASRSEIEQAATALFAEQLKTFKIDTDGVFIADIGLSKTEQGAELMRTQTEREIAIQQKETWAEKERAEKARASQVRASTEADQEKQKAEAQAQIEIKKSEAMATVEEATGRAEAYAKQIEAVGGFDNFVMLEVAKMMAQQWKGEVPDVVVSGENGGLSPALMSRVLQSMSEAKK